MDQVHDETRQQRLGEFQCRLETLLGEHTTALHLASARAVAADLRNLQPRPPFPRRVRRGGGRLVKWMGRKPLVRRGGRRPASSPFGTKPTAAPVVVVEGTYRVITTGEVFETEEATE